jgi:hypothetical protein
MYMAISPKSRRCRSSVKGRESQMGSHDVSSATPPLAPPRKGLASAKKRRGKRLRIATIFFCLRKAKQSISSPQIQLHSSVLPLVAFNYDHTQKLNPPYPIPQSLAQKTRWPAFLPKCMDTSPRAPPPPIYRSSTDLMA